MKKPFSSFGICGNKDKRGITTQRVSAYVCAKEDLIKINGIEKINDQLQVSNFDYVPKDGKLGLGSLKGNRFSILLRFISAEDSVIEHNILSLK